MEWFVMGVVLALAVLIGVAHMMAGAAVADIKESLELLNKYSPSPPKELK